MNQSAAAPSSHVTSNPIQTTDMSCDIENRVTSKQDLLDPEENTPQTNVRQKRVRRANGRQKVQFVDSNKSRTPN